MRRASAPFHRRHINYAGAMRLRQALVAVTVLAGASIAAADGTHSAAGDDAAALAAADAYIQRGRHSAARIHQALTNLTATGLPVELTEFGVKKGASRAEAARILEETMRMVFGTPGTTGFVMFGFWAGAIWDTAPEAVLVDADWKLTEAGTRYERLMAAWSTDATIPLRADGTIEFTGFYGDYAVEVSGKAFAFELVTGKTGYELR
jgi:hypothetical protein